MVIFKEKSIGRGWYTITSEDIRTGKVSKRTRHNVLTKGMMQAIYAFLDPSNSLQDADALNVSHIAVGTGTTTATPNDVKLETEIYRKPITLKSFNSQRFRVTLFLEAAEGNPTGGFIKELACFTNATDTTDSGLMISRATVNVQKTENIKLNIVWECQIN